ncbi:MAG: hypothetical protein HYZ21_11955 [Chloroflexi bacterium]|nr:hypothetical protein [Chloroflexota bacterium]
MSEIFSFISSGIIGGFLGAFLGGFAKFFWDNWLPSQMTWRREQKVERDKLLSQFRNPAIAAISDLQGRIFVLLQGGNYAYLRKIDMEDYYILSTAFLVAQFFAWVEILLQKMSMLDYSELTSRLEKATGSFSHGYPGFQIFRLEQREIGQRMLNVPVNSNLQCLGYAEFIDMMKKPNRSACFSRLEKITKKLLEDPGNEMARLTAIQHALIDLIVFLDPKAEWVPPNRRDKFDLLASLENKKPDRNSPKTYNKILRDMQTMGLMSEDSTRGKMSKPASRQ